MKTFLIIIVTYFTGFFIGISTRSNGNTNTPPTNVPENPPTGRTNWSRIVRSHSHNF